MPKKHTTLTPKPPFSPERVYTLCWICTVAAWSDGMPRNAPSYHRKAKKRLEGLTTYLERLENEVRKERPELFRMIDA